MDKKLLREIPFILLHSFNKQLRCFLLGLFILPALCANAQNIAINATNTAPNSSAVLDLSANTAGGFLLPYMSTGQMNSIASPTNGLLIFNYTAGCVMGYDASSGVAQWQTLYCPCTGAPTQPNKPTGTTTVCQSSTYTYSINRVNAQSYIWEVNPSGGGTFSGTGTNVQTCPDTAVTINWGTTPGTYEVIAIANDGCAEQYAAAPILQVTVLPTPAAPTITGDASIVKNSTNNYYSVPPISGATYSWSIAGGTVGTFVGSTTTNTVNLTAPASAGTNTLTVSETYCSSTVSSTFTVTINNSCTVTHSNITFNTVGLNSWTVPCGITSITIDMAGAAGGEGYGCSTSPELHNCVDPVYPGDSAADHPGRGARVQATLAVTPGQVLYCYVGAQGTNANATILSPDANGFTYLCAPGGVGGNNDENGGNGYSSQLTPYSTPLGVGSGGGGGGASCIRLSTANSFADDILSAAGGGGVGVDDDASHAVEVGLGGNGGGAGSVPTAGGYSGEAGEAGNAGGAAAGGASSSTTCGGVPVRGCQGSSNGGQNQAVGGGGTTDGDGGDGGMTANCLYGFYGGGGGGGGGHFAGGGGCGGGGGGGYSYTGGYGTNTTSGITVTAGYATRNGYIKITW